MQQIQQRTGLAFHCVGTSDLKGRVGLCVLFDPVQPFHLNLLTTILTRHMPGFILPQIATIVDIRTLMRNYGYYLLKPTRSPP